MRFSRAFSDVTVGTLIVMLHAVLAQRISASQGETAGRGAPPRRLDLHRESSYRRRVDPRAYVHPR